MKWNKYKKSVHIGLWVLGFVLFLQFSRSTEPVDASTWNNAYEYYNVYGGECVFHPTSENNGLIFFGSRGATSSGGIRYRTIGWKLGITALDGSILQEIYFALDGDYLTRIDNTRTHKYEYNLYAVSLSSIRSRMAYSVRERLDRGQVAMHFDACMVVYKNGRLLGGMNDYGPSYGSVYTTYYGIVNAQNWSSGSRSALHSYFNKSISGLFHYVDVRSGTGIAYTSGSGTYCYGTLVTISATPQRGYTFSQWIGQGVQTSQTYQFYVTQSLSWTAYAKEQQLTVTYYRNLNGADSSTVRGTYAYSRSGQRMPAVNWTKEGYCMIGWAFSKNATKPQYSLMQEISPGWIALYAPAVNLYAVWQENQYTIRYVWIDASTRRECKKEIKVGYSANLSLADSPGGCESFVGWSLKQGRAFDEAWKSGTSLSVSQLAKECKVTGTNDAVITLYAISNANPAIDVNDYFFSLEDARSGKLTEDYLARFAHAYDYEDGDITYGKHEKNSFEIVHFDAEKMKKLKDREFTEVEFMAVDSDGNCVTKKVHLTVCDTASKNPDHVSIRFVSKDYYSTQKGFAFDSIWMTNPRYQSLLESVFQGR